MKTTVPKSQTKQPDQEFGSLQTKRVQASGAGQIGAPPIVHEVLRSPGQPLDASTRAFMEPRFGHDFAQVRVHHDAKAAESARAVQARAYTVGQSVVFGEGNFAPATQQGRELLGHELAHTIQQRSGSIAPAAFADSQAIFEAAATTAAHEVANGRTFSGALPACGRQIQRSPVGDLQWKKDVNAARYRGQLMANRIRKHGLLSKEARAKANEELAYFEGKAKEVYLREVKPALAPFVEIEMAPMDLRPAPPEPAKPEPTDAERDYEARLAYYSSTRQAQLEAKERGPNLDRLNASQRLDIWRNYWGDRWKNARADLLASRQLGPDKRLAAEEKAEAGEESANGMLSGVNLAQEYFLALDDAGTTNLTWAEANRAISEIIQFHNNMVAAAGMFAALAMPEPGGPASPRRTSAVTAAERVPGNAEPPASSSAGETPAPPAPRQTIKASPPPPPARPGAPPAVTDVEVIQTNVRTPSAIKPQSPGAHQTDWQARGGSGTAPAAYRDADGNVRISTDHPLMGGGKGGISPVRSQGTPAAPPSAKTPPTASAPPPASTTSDIGLDKTGQAPAPAKPVADPMAKTPAAQQPAVKVSPRADTGAAASESQRAQAPRGHIDPPQAVSREAVERMQNQPAPAAARKGRGSGVNYTADHEAHELAWNRLGGHGDSPPAFIYDRQVYLDPSRWPPGQ